MIRQPTAADLSWPRYSSRHFPNYRFIPAFAPHPLRNPEGHSFHSPAPRPKPFPPEQWRSAPTYLFGIDCYNYAFWWESHEVLEEIWKAVGRGSRQGQFLQGLIQIAAAWLHRCRGDEPTTTKQARAGLARLAKIPDLYMGIETRELEAGVRDYLDGRRDTYPLIRLVGLDPVGVGPGATEVSPSRDADSA